MSHEEEIELRDRMILVLAKALSKDPTQQHVFIRLAEDDARDAMSDTLYVIPNPKEA